MKLKTYLSVFLLGAACAVFLATYARADAISIIDAHSQLEQKVRPARVIELMDKAGVARTILAARRGTTVKQIRKLARQHPGRITAAVRTKGGAYQDKDLGAFRAFLKKQVKHPEFGAIAETLMFHAEKQNKKGEPIAPEVFFEPDHPKVQLALRTSRKKGWPFIAHIEFASLAPERRTTFMKKFEAMLSANRDHPIVLIHMGQLGPDTVARLINAHSNIFFLSAHNTPTMTKRSREPWTKLFDGEDLAPAWRALIISRPDRFVLGFDNVWENHWEKYYLPQIREWRAALADLPHDVAHAIAHKNAERLWHLPPAK